MPTILLVEDNPITRKFLRVSLTNAGYTVLEAPTGASALDQLEQGKPDLVLLDLGLPDLDGFDLAERMRMHPDGARVPILACTSSVGPHDDRHAAAVGFDDVIPKPIEPSKLVHIVQGYLPARRMSVDAFGGGQPVLVVDDDPIQVKVLAYRLSEFGFKPVTANDGEEALATAKKLRPSYIVSDVMMPRLDGFGLCQAVRADPAIADAFVLLATNTYVEQADRDLAWRLGADDLLLRTPELTEVVDALKRRLDGQTRPRRVAVAEDLSDEMERERNRRVMRQLEKQVGINARQMQRTATLAAELMVVNAISEALVDDVDLDVAMGNVLAACLDAGGVSVGALCVFGSADDSRIHTFGEDQAAAELRSVVRDPRFVRDLVRGHTFHLDLPQLGHYGVALEQLVSAIVVPVVYRAEVLGGLILASTVSHTDTVDRVAFAETVANQLALVVVLMRAFKERADSERQAKNQTDLLASIFDAVADGVAAVAPDGHFTHWNSAATAILKIGPVETGAETWSEHYGLYHADGALVASEDLPLVRALRGERVDGMEMLMRRRDSPDGTWLSVNARQLRDERQVAGAVAVFRDVTTQKKMQSQLMMSDRMASVGMLAAGVAHEINNPLAAVIANLDFIDEDFRAYVAEVRSDTPRAREIRESISEARTASDRVRQIVKDLRIFSRAEEDKRAAIDIERVIESSLRMAWNEIRHRARLVKNFGKVPRVLANESRLGQVFLNLVVNGAQAIPEGRESENQIIITTSTDAEGWAVTEIRDSGPGIPPELLGKLFTPFFTTKPAGQGTGLGLVICQQIINTIGGRITLESVLGEGTTCRVFLPPYDGEETSPDASSQQIRRSVRRGFVLSIDDDPMIANVVKRALGSEHEVVTVDTARAALELLDGSVSFDVILCDLMMPVMTGVDFYRELARRSPALADDVVFFTGGAFTPAAREFLDQIPNLRIEKPFDLANLRSLVNDRVRQSTRKVK